MTFGLAAATRADVLHQSMVFSRWELMLNLGDSLAPAGTSTVLIEPSDVMGEACSQVCCCLQAWCLWARWSAQTIKATPSACA